MMAAFVWLHALMWSSQLHHQCHDEANLPDHHCVVTDWQSGIDHGAPRQPAIEVPVVEVPAFVGVCTSVEVIATQLRGGVLAQSPPRAP